MPHLTTYLGLVSTAEQTLADSFRVVGEGHAAEADVFHTCATLARMSDDHVRLLQPVVDRYGEAARADETDADDTDEPERLHAAGLAEVRPGAVGLLRDLQDLHVLGTLVQTTWTVLVQGAQALRDRDLLQVAETSNAETSRQLAWLNTRMKAAAPAALLMS
jgi:hypothetical protein